MPEGKIERKNMNDVLTNFGFPSQFITVKPFGSGHINDTYLVEYVSNEDAFLLQRINHHVFKNVEDLMDNIVKVTLHLKKHIQNIYPKDFDQKIMTAMPANDGKYFYEDLNGDFWRVFNYLKNTKSYDIVTTENQAYEGGQAFGEFQSLLSDLDPTFIKETIPDFHNIKIRLIKFWKALSANPLGRAKNITLEIDLINSRSNKMDYIIKQARAGKLPLRVIHNDTKFNNILLDQNDKAQCVIDLDTVMPGYVAYDFGDAIRTIINTTVEDEKDLEKIGINLSLYQAFVRGYLTKTIGFLTHEEIDSLPAGAILFPYMQAIRFLTDYIEGDHYYKTEFKEHNLQRGKAQLQLFLKMENEYDKLKSIVLEILDETKKTIKFH